MHPDKIEAKKYQDIQKKELSYWEHAQYSPIGSWKFYDEVFAEHVPQIMMTLPVRIIGDIGSGPVPYFNNDMFIQPYISYHAVDPLILEYWPIERYRAYDKFVFSTYTSIRSVNTDFLGLAICTNTLDHVQDVSEMLYQIWRVIHPGGYLLFCVDVDKPTDAMHPHKLDSAWLSGRLTEDYETIHMSQAKSWKFKNDILWFVGRKALPASD